MSLVSDALDKVQRERSRSGVEGGSVRYHVAGRNGPRRPVVRVQSLSFIWTNVAVLALLFSIAIYYLRNRPQSSVTTSGTSPAVNVTPAPVAVAPSTEIEASPQSVLPETPTLPEAAPSAPATRDYGLSGMTILGKETLLGITRQSDKHSFWVPVGKTVGEITAVSYDGATDQAVIRVRDRLLTVAMQNGSAPAAQPAE